ncbi:MAG: acyl-homoserine-lactone synthase [Thiobacillus sp.]|nr:acyl-homoserine-lactone synthase [Thiobacillus sp.]
MRIFSGTQSELQPGLVTGVAHYRHKVFVQKLGWQLQCENALEYDQFDRDDTVYVVAQNDAEEIIGTARLLPTTRPYLLGEVFPQLLNGLPPPASAEIWELSRFAAVDFNAPTTSSLGQFSSPIAVDLLRASLKSASAHGAKQLITVSPLGVERLLRSAGVSAHRAGPPMMVDGSPIFACWISF